jgi:hypothetical protein
MDNHGENLFLNFLDEAGDESFPIDLVGDDVEDDDNNSNDDDEVGRSANAGGAIGAATAREVTPVPEASMKPPAKHTIKSALCGRMDEVLKLSDRKKFLVDLVAEGHQQIFSSQYMKDHLVVITNLLEAIQFSSTQKLGWNSPKVAEQMVNLHGHMVADTERRRRSRASTAFLSFIEEVAKRVEFENTAIENRLRREKDPPNPPPGATKKRTKKNAKPREIPQASLTWDPKKKDNLPCPACGHSTVMIVHVEEAPSTQVQRAMFKEKLAEWNALTRTEQGKKTKPTFSSLKIGSTVERRVCMCCVMTCMNGSHNCPHCSKHPPTFFNGQCTCVQCRCQCKAVFDARERQKIAREARAAATNPPAVARPGT